MFMSYSTLFLTTHSIEDISISLKDVMVGTLKRVTLHYTQVIPSNVPLSLDVLFDCK
jgi:hypothetical protein